MWQWSQAHEHQQQQQRQEEEEEEEVHDGGRYSSRKSLYRGNKSDKERHVKKVQEEAISNVVSARFDDSLAPFPPPEKSPGCYVTFDPVQLIQRRLYPVPLLLLLLLQL